MATATANKRHTPSKREVRDAAQEQTNKVIALLEAGTVIWHQDWSSLGGDTPTSLSTGKEYGGSNVLMLMFTAMVNGYSSKYWGTYAEMARRAGLVLNEKTKRWNSPLLPDGTVDPTPRGVRKGEKSTEIIRVIEFFVKDADKIDPETGEPAKKKIRQLRLHHVYNADQCNFPEGSKGVPAGLVREHKETIAEAEELVAKYLANGPSLAHGGSKAFYRPATDHVQMPAFADFQTAEGYFTTLYHELTHSSGHSSRLAREGIAQGTFGAFGDPVYSFEELVAELGACFLTAIAGIDQSIVLDNSAAYIAHWLKALKQDKNLIIQAASQAQAAVNHILGTATTTDNTEGEAE